MRFLIINAQPMATGSGISILANGARDVLTAGNLPAGKPEGSISYGCVLSRAAKVAPQSSLRHLLRPQAMVDQRLCYRSRHYAALDLRAYARRR